VKTHVIETPHGEAWLWGEADALTGDKPVVLKLHGAFSIARPRTFELQRELPEAAVLCAHLPGWHCPRAATPSVESFAALYSDVLRQIGRPAIVVGSSVGALVAFAIRAPQVKGIVALEPPLVTGKLWPLAEPFRDRLRNGADAYEREFLWSVFGLSETRFQDRDYRPLLERLAVPTLVMLGGLPLMPQRSQERLASLVDDPERRLLAAHPNVRVRELAAVGHNVGGPGFLFVRSETRALLASLQLIKMEAS
jgi:pimeloyl-ACP methyl ester carboxylesterase